MKKPSKKAVSLTLLFLILFSIFAYCENNLLTVAHHTAENEKLPSVRELASQLTINPNTIQRAYRELEMGGWIATVAGKGCFVCGVPSEARPEKLALLKQFDDTAAALQMLGVSRKELMERLQGGKNNA